MQLFAGITGWGDWLYYLVVPFLFVLTIVVFFHELGHFLVARWCGIRVQVFSVGFGRELFGNDRATAWFSGSALHADLTPGSAGASALAFGLKFMAHAVGSVPARHSSVTSIRSPRGCT